MRPARALATLALAIASAWCAEATGAPPRGDPAARLLPHDDASDVWDLTIRLDRGHWIVAQATVTNFGPGAKTAAVVGHVIEPDGETHEFHKIRRTGAWQLSEDGRRLDLDAIHLDQSISPARFYVSKKRVDLDLRIDLSGRSAWPAPIAGDEAGFDLLALAAPVVGTLELRGQEVLNVSGRATLTHRWMAQVEAKRVTRRVELFAMEGGLGVYFLETHPPAGPARRWLVAGRDGRIWVEDETVKARYTHDPDGSGVGLSAGGLHGEASLGPVLLRDEPLGRAPWLARWWYGRITKPRFVWSAAPFDFALRPPGSSEPLRFRGRALVNVARFDPSGAGSGEAGWGER